MLICTYCFHILGSKVTVYVWYLYQVIGVTRTNVPANEPWLQFMARVASLSIPLLYYPNKIHTLNRFWNLISHCSTRIIHNKLERITSIWYETSQPVALSQGRHHTYTRHSKTPHSVVNAVECSRQRPVISTRTERRETAGMHCCHPPQDQNAGVMRTGQESRSQHILQWEQPISNQINLSRLAPQVHSLHN